MPLFQTFKVNDSYDTLVNTSIGTWLFDYNVEMYNQKLKFEEQITGIQDKNSSANYSHSDTSHTSSKKKACKVFDDRLLFRIRKYIAVDSVFVSNFNSLGVLFLKNTKIFITRPVYEQIILRYQELMDLKSSRDINVVKNASSYLRHRSKDFDINYNENRTIDGYASLTTNNGIRDSNTVLQKRKIEDSLDEGATKKLKVAAESNSSKSILKNSAFINDLNTVNNLSNLLSNNAKYEIFDDYNDLESEECITSAFYNINHKTVVSEDVDYFIVNLDKVSIESFKKNVVFIRNFHIIEKEGYSVESVPAGTSIGCCNYKITFPNKKSILILNSYSSKRRFSIEAPQITTDYLLLCRNNSCINYESVHTLSALFKEYCTSNTINLDALRIRSLTQSVVKTIDCNQPLLIPVNFQTFFIEILFHLLSVVEPYGLNISIVSPIYNQLETLLNIQSEWLNKDFFSISEPFPLKDYGKIKAVKSLSEVEGNKRIVFCSHEYYNLNKENIKDCTVLQIDTGRGSKDILIQKTKLDADKGAVNSCKKGKKTEDISCFVINFNLKIENTNDEILQNYKGKVIDKNSTFLEGENTVDCISVHSNLTVFGNSIIFNGELVISDFDNPKGIVKRLNDKKVDIKKLLAQEEAIYHDGWYFLTENKIKFKIDGETIEVRNI